MRRKRRAPSEVDPEVYYQRAGLAALLCLFLFLSIAVTLLFIL